MRNFSVDRVQYPIGQGGFHSTVIHSYGERFSAVIDCGGGEKKVREHLIGTFAADGKKSKHDILVISHLDEDHINGIPKLLEQATFRYIFLPHIDLQQYILWMTLKLAVGYETAADDELEQFTHSLEVLSGLFNGAYGKIVLVSPPNSREGDTNNDGGIEDDANDSVFLSASTEKILKSGKLASDKSLHFSEINWQFRFYSREWTLPAEVSDIWDKEVFDELKRALIELVKKSDASDSSGYAEDALNCLKRKAQLNLLEESDVNLIGKTKPVSVKHLLGLFYKQLKGLSDYNDASVCVYSGPIRRGTQHSYGYWFRRVVEAKNDAFKWAKLQIDSVNSSVGWMHTGDISFNSDDKLETFLHHYDAELPVTSTLVLPHHGSKHSYDKNLYRLTRLSECMAEPPLFIAAANPNGRYKHPHLSVVSCCNSLGNLHVVSDCYQTKVIDSVQSRDYFW